MFKSFQVILIGATLTFAAPQPISPNASSEIGFSPNGQSLDVILKAIGEAKQEILVAAYSFTSKPISTALLAAHKRGVSVQVVADKKSNSGKYSATTFLANQGVPVRLNGNYAIFHHKFMIIDHSTLETGSFNYSAAAESKNSENVIVLRGVPEITKIYANEWSKLWNEATVLAPKY
jgi:phosphatidylserine/phosphatidylglycerophosphate/cardiolipin synthase-like enzyme